MPCLRRFSAILVSTSAASSAVIVVVFHTQAASRERCESQRMVYVIDTMYTTCENDYGLRTR